MTGERLVSLPSSQQEPMVEEHVIHPGAVIPSGCLFASF